MKDVFIKSALAVIKILWKGIKLVGLVFGIIILLLLEKLQWLAKIIRRKWATFSKNTRQAILVAAILHVVILLIAATLIAVPGKRSSHEIVATIVDQPSIPDVQQQQLSAIKQIRQIQPSASSAISKMMLTQTQAAINLPPTKVDVRAISFNPDVGDLGIGNGFGKGNGSGAGGGSAFSIEIRGRCVPGERIRLLRKNGGTPEVEEAISKSLKWLKKSQNFNGTWGDKYQSSMTAFALLCYLGRCEKPASKEYGKTVAKGIQALLEMGKKNKNGYFTNLNEHTFVYEHGIATYALGEALAMTQGNEIPGLRVGFTRGVKKIIEGQAPDGGWLYGYTKESTGDLSIVGWQVQALKAAQRLNIQITGLDSCIESAATFVSNRQGPAGGFGYRKTGDKASLAGVGVLSLQFLGHPSRSQAQKAFAYWFEKTPTFFYTSGSCNLYAAYYINQASFNFGGGHWKKWNAQMRPELLKSQSSNGSYPIEGGERSIDLTGEDSKLYRTTLCTLMLEVYYRYLPINEN